MNRCAIRGSLSDCYQINITAILLEHFFWNFQNIFHERVCKKESLIEILEDRSERGYYSLETVLFR